MSAGKPSVEKRQTGMGPRRFARFFVSTFLFLVANVAVSIAVVAVYAYFINPGQTNEFYQEFANTYSPYSSILAGMPLMFALCWWLNRTVSAEDAYQAVWIVWILYVVLDLGISFAAGPMTPRLALLTAISLTTKLAAGWLGAKLAVARARAPIPEDT